MGNIHQAGVKKDDHGGGDNQQLQVVSVLELQAGVVEDQPQPLGGWHAVEATSMVRASLPTVRLDVLRPRQAFIFLSFFCV